MTLVKNSLLQFSLDAQASLFTVSSVAGGSLTLKDELKFTYFIAARRQRAGEKAR